VSGTSKSSRAGARPFLCYVTDRRALWPDDSSDTRASLSRKIETLVAAGIDCVQIREKDLFAREIGGLAREALRSSRAAAERGRLAPRIVINDRLDVAIAMGAGGVHLGENGLPARAARSLLEKSGCVADFLVGVSCHSRESVNKAEEDGADYVFFGPVFATPSKVAFGSPQGIAQLTQACRSVSIPVIAIGGITLENVGACFAAGASGVAAIRLFQEAADPAALIRALKASAR
jgi:thiamine-phosphate pyrophosphorylase